MTKNRKRLSVYLFLIMGVAGCLWVTFPVIKDIWLLLINFPTFYHFSMQTIDRTPRYDALNEAVYGELPKPFEGASEKKSRARGNAFLTNEKYGRELGIQYQLKEERSFKEITNYYKSELSLEGWTYDPQSGNYGEFTKGTACIRISEISLVYPEDPGANYYIYIWHDFFKQEFSPAFPDFPTIGGMNAFGWYTFGETGFYTCPSD